MSNEIFSIYFSDLIRQILYSSAVLLLAAFHVGVILFGKKRKIYCFYLNFE